MHKYLENLNRIEFVVTMACTGKEDAYIVQRENINQVENT